MQMTGQIADAVRNASGCILPGIIPDPDHNRSVLTFIGAPGPVESAAVSLAREAVRLIDLTRHTGGHPRMGAVDVVPFHASL